MNLPGQSDPYETTAEGLAGIRGDSDVLALLPYDDGTFWLKPADFNKELFGGKGGYETDDGDKIVMDGDGEPKRDLLGTHIILALDPTEHAAAVEPLKAAMAQKNNMGEWLKIDKLGNVIEAGEAIVQAPDSEVQVGPEGSLVAERAQELAQERSQDQPLPPEAFYEEALEELEEQGAVTKIYDIAPPSYVSENGEEIEIEEATHIAVDQARGADLLPKTFSTTEINTALDKARMEEHEPRELKRDLMFLAAGFIGSLLMAGVMAGIFNFM